MTNYPTPSLRRRLICMMYESFLLFGVIFISAMLFDVLTSSKHALTLRHARMAWIFLAIGAYFYYFWMRGGQTLAMKTWRIQLSKKDGSPLDRKAAVLRYVGAWMWFIPALALNAAFSLKKWPSIIAILIGFCAWALLVYLDPQRQFAHDRMAGTRLNELPKPLSNAKTTEAD